MAEVNKTFDLYPWHDAELVSINIDRSSPGRTDRICLVMNWSHPKKKVVFDDVYRAMFYMNFGVITGEHGEPIYSASEKSSGDEEVSRLYEDWKHRIDDIPLFCYEIIGASTNSKVSIISKGFHLE